MNIFVFLCFDPKKIVIKQTEVVFLKRLWSPGIDSKELIPPAYALVGQSPYCICRCLKRPGIDSEELIQQRAGIFKQSMGTRNRVIGPARQSPYL
jgi:hypothetical protein